MVVDKESVEVRGSEEPGKNVTDRVAEFGWYCVETDEGEEREGEVEFIEVVLEGGLLGVEMLAFEDAVVDRVLDRAVIATISAGS